MKDAHRLVFSRLRRLCLALAAGTMLQVGSCGLTVADQEQLSSDARGVAAVVIGNFVANTVGFFLNNAVVRAVGGCAFVDRCPPNQIAERAGRLVPRADAL